MGEMLYVSDRAAWRAWLKKYHKLKKEIWLIYFKKHTGKPRIPYDDAVEEALCFGWIDSTIKRIDDEKYSQKFTPRRRKSVWSNLNIKRARKMIDEGRMTEIGLALFDKREKYRKGSTHSNLKKTAAVPPELKAALSADKTAMENFINFAPSYKRIYIAWINDAKKEETKAKRIKKVVERSAGNIKPGML